MQILNLFFERHDWLWKCYGTGMFIPGPGSDFFTSRIPDLGLTRSRIRINFNPKNWYSVLKNKIRNVYPGSQIWFFSIPDRGAKKALDPGSRSAILNRWYIMWIKTRYSQMNMNTRGAGPTHFFYSIACRFMILLRYSGGVRRAGLLQEDLPQVQAVRLRVPVDPGQGAGPHHQARTARTTTTPL